MSKKDFTATIAEQSDRYQDWMKVLGTNEVILKHPLPKLGSAPGVSEALFYEMDLTALSGEQRTRLITHLAERFHLPEKDVLVGLDREGCPILSNDVVVAIHNPQRWT